MKVNDAFKTATRSLLHGKMRSVLTMLGIVIGIASVIILMSIGQSAQNLILNQVEGIGSNLIYVIPGGTPNGRLATPAQAQGIIVQSLTQQDVDALQREISITAVVPEVRGQADVVYGENDVVTTYMGENADFFPVRDFKTTQGYPFTQSDVDSFNHVAVVGSALADTLFGPNINPIGKQIRVKNFYFRVVGVLEKKGTGPMGIDQDNIVIVPLYVAQKQMLGITFFHDIIAQADPNYDEAFVKDRMSFILRQNHAITDPNKDDFTVRSQEDALTILKSVTSIMTTFLAAIASISLIVGGIGIMNIMLVSVTERTREIGLRKAVGATDADILEQFLIESVVLTVIGGIVGITLGGVVVGIAYEILSTVLDTGWTFAFPLSSVFMALGVSTVAGLVFGIYPARQAAKKHPIDALRYE